MVKLAIIGAGQLGGRHLQALALIDRKARIQVVDTSPASLELAKARFCEVHGSGNVQDVELHKSINDLWDDLDLVIVATNANVRSMVVEELLHTKKTKYIILEKVLFQKLKDYTAIAELLKSKKVKSWVNCPKRIWPFYQQLKEKFKGVEKVEYNVSGSDLGIGCNAIHYIDNLAFLIGQDQFTFFNDQLDPDTISSKRAGFIEFTGTLQGITDKRSRISISSYNGGDAPLIIQIKSEKVRCLIMEDQGRALVSEKENNWIWQEVNFTVPYQSQLTHIVVQEILDTEKCDLPDFNEAAKLHVPMLETLIKHLQKECSGEKEICPIT
ncbi:MAG: Gfo/Idh/MocA family oxidoreductase [Desulfitobacterium hafniense]|nr:Gfo/Idh/MocA family oxidoreductase [Desulfitobacterium hafniense]